jgi:hypothetical protein
VDSAIQHSPAVHVLCAGAFLQSKATLSELVVALPLSDIGFGTEAEYTVRYAETVGAQIDDGAIASLAKQGANARPALVLVVRRLVETSPTDLEAAAWADVDRALAVLGWLSGEVPVPFAIFTRSKGLTYFRLLPPHSVRRRHLPFHSPGHGFDEQLQALFVLAQQDERFEFALTLFREALHERNAELRAARMFSCLESLAFRIKGGKGSRDRVRFLLGVENGASVNMAEGDERFSFDRIELAGRIRDKLFHGQPILEGHLGEGAQKALRAMRREAAPYRDLLESDCWVEFARWANGTSRGLQEHELPEPAGRGSFR